MGIGGHVVRSYPSPFSTVGTRITDITTSAHSIAARTHCTANQKMNLVELWYWRDGAWNLYSELQPITSADLAPKMHVVYREPATLEFALRDPNNRYAPNNRNTAENYNAAGTFDPILDAARKILLRVGTACFTNLAAGLTATSSISPSSGSLTLLTNGPAVSYHQSFWISPSAPVRWTVNNTTLNLDFNLGSVQFVRHACVRFGSKLSVPITLPVQVQMFWSADGSTWVPGPKRPVGGAGDTNYPAGDWDDGYYGIAVEVPFCDLDVQARYVRFAVTTTSNIGIAIDEICIYGGNTAPYLGKNMFMGYLGDSLEITPDGIIKLTATDISKKLKDNNECSRLTPPFFQNDAADIVYSLLTSSAFWRDINEYTEPFDSSDVLWSSGTDFTGMKYPVWQGQANNVLGYAYELVHSIGWTLTPTGDGQWKLEEPPYDQRSADQFIGAGENTNNNGRNFIRKYTDQNLRNEVFVTSGHSREGNPGTSHTFEPNSIARYGPRITRIEDPILMSRALRDKVGQYFIRDYAWNLQTLSANINPDYDTGIRGTFAFRGNREPQLFARNSDKAGDKRRAELWTLQSITHRFEVGRWEGECEFSPIFPFSTSVPTFNSFTTSSGLARLVPDWDYSSDPLGQKIRLYISDVSDTTGFVAVAEYTPSTTTATYNSTYPLLAGGTGTITVGDRYWAYIVSVDTDGNESYPSPVLTVIAGSAVSPGSDCNTLGDGSGYVISDYAVSLVSGPVGPDADGYYTYQFYATWTSPHCGLTQQSTHMSPDALPFGTEPEDSEITNWPWSDSSWDWWSQDRIPEGMYWDYTTAGQLDFTYTLRTNREFLSGERIYFRLWNSTATRRWIPVASNYDYVEF